MTFILPSNFRQIPLTWEMAQPFHIDATGAVAFEWEPIKWAENHILALLLTDPGERVMRPTYGVGMYGMVFEYDDPLVEQNILTAINSQLANYEPTINVIQCQFMVEPSYTGVMHLELQFTVGNAPAVHSVAFTTTGTSVEVSQ